VLVDEHAHAHPQRASYDSSANHLEYQAMISSPFLSPSEIFLRVREVLRDHHGS
jgi:hypothetical protein